MKWFVILAGFVAGMTGGELLLGFILGFLCFFLIVVVDERESLEPKA